MSEEEQQNPNVSAHFVLADEKEFDEEAVKVEDVPEGGEREKEEEDTVKGVSVKMADVEELAQATTIFVLKGGEKEDLTTKGPDAEKGMGNALANAAGVVYDIDDIPERGFSTVTPTTLEAKFKTNNELFVIDDEEPPKKGIITSEDGQGAWLDLKIKDRVKEHSMKKSMRVKSTLPVTDEQEEEIEVQEEKGKQEKQGEGEMGGEEEKVEETSPEKETPKEEAPKEEEPKLDPLPNGFDNLEEFDKAYEPPPEEVKAAIENEKKSFYEQFSKTQEDVDVINVAPEKAFETYKKIKDRLPAFIADHPYEILEGTYFKLFVYHCKKTDIDDINTMKSYHIQLANFPYFDQIVSLPRVCLPLQMHETYDTEEKYVSAIQVFEIYYYARRYLTRRLHLAIKKARDNLNIPDNGEFNLRMVSDMLRSLYNTYESEIRELLWEQYIFNKNVDTVIGTSTVLVEMIQKLSAVAYDNNPLEKEKYDKVDRSMANTLRELVGSNLNLTPEKRFEQYIKINDHCIWKLRSLITYVEFVDKMSVAASKQFKKEEKIAMLQLDKQALFDMEMAERRGQVAFASKKERDDAIKLQIEAHYKELVEGAEEELNSIGKMRNFTLMESKVGSLVYRNAARSIERPYTSDIFFFKPKHIQKYVDIIKESTLKYNQSVVIAEQINKRETGKESVENIQGLYKESLDQEMTAKKSDIIATPFTFTNKLQQSKSPTT